MSNEAPHERLSACLDGDLSAHRLDTFVAEVAGDEDMRRCWGRYHLIGDVLRGEAAGPFVADAVRSALAREPVVVAPRRRGANLARWLGPAAGLAVAASVGALVVLLLPRAGGVRGPENPDVALAPPARLEIVRSDPIPAAGRLPRPNQGMESELHRYLTAHSDYAASGMKGPLPLAPLLVGYGAER